MDTIFFSGWEGLLRILITGLVAYVGLIFVLRITGKRTLSKLNAFDLVVTVALGSTLATVITSKDLPLAEGMLALSLLVGLQYLATYASVRWPWFDSLIKAEPTLLLRDGQPLQNAMKRERVTEDELRASVRQAGAREIDEAAAIFLETDGSLSAMLKKDVVTPLA